MSTFNYDTFEAKVLEHLRTLASSGLGRVEMSYAADNQTFPCAWVVIGEDEEIENDINGQRSFEIPFYIGIEGLTKTSVNSCIRKIGVLWYANSNALKAELYAYNVQEVTIIGRFRPNPPAPEIGTMAARFYGGVQVNFLINDDYTA